MVKYSFIVPVYNTEKYLKKCLDSLVKQTYKDFEIIIVNDGSTDDSYKIIDNYNNKYNFIKVITQKNKGLSEARNSGVRKSAGDYLIFIDSDDYVEKDLLKNIDKKIGDVDVLRYQINKIGEHSKEYVSYEQEEFLKLSGKEAFKIISSYHYVEPAWCYAFSSKYWNGCKYKFKKGVYHEDFGLIPYVIYKAKSVSSINYFGYYYVIRQGSIMNNSNYDKTYKKVYDMFELYKDIKNKVSENNSYLLSYMANCAIVKAKELNKKDRKKYLNELKNMNVVNDVISDSFSRKIKKILMKLSLSLYLKVVK